jgi:hypothetical protein
VGQAPSHWLPAAHHAIKALDPTNRLVAAQLEARWNAALRQAQEPEERLRDFDAAGKTPAVSDKGILMSLARDLAFPFGAKQQIRP